MREITGVTRLFGILADPVHHVQTPQRMNEHFAKLGYDGVLVPFHARPEDLATVVAALRRLENLRGVVVTVPHKSAILSLCDHASEARRLIGAANVVRREADGTLTAQMLDGEGFVRGLLSTSVELAGKTAYLAGAGGAASAIGFALAHAGVSSLTIANRTRDKAEDLRRRILALYPQASIRVGSLDASGHDIVINGTSLGLAAGDELPMDVSTLDATQLVCEVIMQPRQTKLLSAARERGCALHYGAPMLACQIELMAEFLGVRDER
jgi:shikimate dehydrogenase